MNDQAVAQVQQSRGDVEYIPFGADTKIKLSIKIIKDFVAIPTKSGKLPDDRDCMRFMMLSRARKLNPFEGDCFLQGYDGQAGPQFSLITAHQAFLKRAEVNPEYDGMLSGVIVSDENDQILDRKGDFLFPGDKLLGGWAIVTFKTRKVPTERRLNLETFDQGFGRWKKDPAGMIVKCAEADALRSSFPTMLGGLYSEPEMSAVIDIAPSPVKSPNFGPSDGSPKRTALKEPAKTAETTAKTAQEASKQSQADVDKEMTQKQPPASSGEQDDGKSPDNVTDIADLKPKAEFKPRAGATEELNNVLFLAHKSGIPEATVVQYCRANKLLKPEQAGLAEMASQKLLKIAESWETISQIIQKSFQ